MREITIVGNAALSDDYSMVVDRSDLVVRFNIPRTFNSGSGNRFDIWVIANSAGGSQFAKQKKFLRAVYKDLPSEIWFPRNVEVHRKIRQTHPNGFLGANTEIDFGREILDRNNITTRAVRFDEPFYWNCLRKLKYLTESLDPTMIPSAGFMALIYIVERYKTAKVKLIGFSFEGWRGHPWKTEKKYAKHLEDNGIITII